MKNLLIVLALIACAAPILALGEDFETAEYFGEEYFTGSVPELIDVGLDYILAKINMGCYFQGAYRHDRYELPPDEMRELVINAFAHRQYLQHDAPVFIAIYDSRIEITSPGGLPRGQTVERALAGFSKIRNDVLAKALNYMRFIEEWGSGLKRVNDVLEEYGIPKFSIEDAGFAVRMNVYRAKTPTKKADDVALNANSNTSGQNDVALNVASNVALNHKLVALVKANPGINRMQLSEKLGVTTRTIDRVLVSLVDVFVRRGSNKTGGYYCK